MTATTALAGQRITAAFLNSNIPGPWQAITPLNSWTNVGGGNVTFECRLRDSVTVEIAGLLHSPSAGSTTSVTVGQLPTALIPVSNSQPIQAQVEGTSPVILGCYVTNTGAITIYGSWGSGVNVSISGLVSLDA